MIARFRHQWSRFSAQQGSLLVEVMVGALVLGITTLAVLSGLDGAQDTGARNKARSEYSALAQQDIERLRSKPITALSNYNETRLVRVGTVDYTVTSETEWVRDASGVVSCTDDNTQAEYMKVSSTVTSPNDTQRLPTKETTLLTPAPGAFSTTSGTAAVLLTNRDGSPRAGVTVTLSGPGSYSETTNSLGCAIFGYIASGTYEAQVSGGVTWASQLPATAPVTVNPGRTSLTAIEVEPPGSLQAHFKTPDLAADTAWSRLTVVHAKLPAGVLAFPNDTATQAFSSIQAANLFPHNDAYGVYAGSCEMNNPAVWQSNYFRPGRPGYIELDPGDNLKSVNVVTPTLRVIMRKTTAQARPVHITVTQIDDPCTERLVDTTVDPSTSGSVTVTLPVPFGHYRLCVDDGVNHQTSVSEADNVDIPADRALVPRAPGGLTQTDRVNMRDPVDPAILVPGACP